MNDGNVNNNNKNNNNYVWPVRAGEWNPRAPDAPTASSLFRDLYTCYLRCRRTKRGAINALRFEYRAERNLMELAEELSEGRYLPSRSVRFAVPRPKMREIIAADFRDRVVHHYLVERLERIFEPVFIHDSYACRTDKGVHRAITRVREFIRSGSSNGRKPLYALHLDVKNFFMTIDKRIVAKMVEDRLVKEARRPLTPNPSPLCPRGYEGRGEHYSFSLWEKVAEGRMRGNLHFLNHLTKTILGHDNLSGRIDKGDLRLLERIPPHKSLLTAPFGKGLPIGNLTSQFFANVYLNELDQYCKHTLKCRYYVRYCDDFLILDESPEKLAELREQIREFLMHNLQLGLNERYAAIVPVTKGIDFLGYIIRPDYLLVRRRTVNNLRVKLAGFERKLESKTNPPNPPRQGGTESSSPDKGRRGRGLLLTPTIFRYDYPILAQLRSVLASYLGHFKWANTNRLRHSLFARYPYLGCFYRLDEEGMPQFSASFSSDHATFAAQCRYFAARFPAATLFVQMGVGYVETGEYLAHRPVQAKRNQCDKAAGFTRMHPVFISRISQRVMQRRAKRDVAAGRSVVIVRETGRSMGRLKERLPAVVIADIYGKSPLTPLQKGGTLKTSPFLKGD